VRNLETFLTDDALPPVMHKPLPVRKRWWVLPPDVTLPARREESFSSLENYLFNPYVWVLQYPAKLSGSRMLDVSKGPLLYGNLSHNLIERWLKRPDALLESDDVFNAWFASAFTVIVSEEGAVLEMPGRQEELASFRRKLLYAMQQLKLQLSAAKVTVFKAEERLKGHYVGGEIGGRSDLLLTNAEGTHAILDLKWGSKNYQDKLADNRHLQLTIYGELVRQSTGQWPHLAYFSLSRGELMATDDHFFPRAKLVRKQKVVAEEGATHLWQRFLRTWQWRKGQIDRGEIEIVLAEHDDDLPPEDGLAMEVLNPQYNRFLTLAGWEAQP